MAYETEDTEDVQKPVELNMNDIEESRLNELIRSYITGDDQDADALSTQAFQTKERLARKQLASGSLKIIFDQASDTTMLMGSQDWRKISKL